MSAELPQSWLRVLLNDVGEIVTGKTPSTKNPDNFGGSIPFIKPADLDNGGYVTRTADTLTDAGAKLVPTIPANSIPVTCIGNLGKVGITNQTSATNQQINTVVPSSQVDYRFFYYQLQTLKPWMQENASATTVTIINKGKFSKAPVTLAPLAEQKAIADKLDTLLAQVKNTKARLERIPQILKRFRQSVLAAAVSGRLTEEWRRIHSPSENTEQLISRWDKTRHEMFEEAQRKLLQSGKIKKFRKFKEPSNPDIDTAPPLDIPDSWKLVSVSQFAECLDHMRIPVKKEDRATAKGLYPYFGANGEVDKVDDYIFDGDFVLVTEDETFYGREKPIAYRYSGKCWVNNHAHILQAPTKPANDYLCYSLMHYNVIPWLSGTTGRAKLTQAALNSLPMGMPPETELNEIVRRVDQLFAHADRIEHQVNNALARVNNLTQSILAKAFRGELTEQWRKDNPELISGENSAEALLERIRAERATMKPAKKAGKPKTTA